MPTELYGASSASSHAYRHTLEAVFMISYNEPTVDRRFVELVGILREAGLPPAVLTNGTGLTPQRVDALLALGGLRYLSINLSTLDRERYAADRGGDHLELVLRNLDYCLDQPLAERDGDRRAGHRATTSTGATSRRSRRASRAPGSRSSASR